MNEVRPDNSAVAAVPDSNKPAAGRDAREQPSHVEAGPHNNSINENSNDRSPRNTRDLSIGWVPHFAASFQLHLESATPRELFQAILLWTRQQLPRGSRPLGTVERFIEGGGYYDHREHVSVQTASFVGSGTADSPQLWAMTLARPQSDFTHRVWRTQIGLTQISPGCYQVNISVDHALQMEYVGEVEAPKLSTPRIVRTLLEMGERVKTWTITSGATELTSSVSHIGHHEIDRFLGAICDPKRKLPLVVFSPLPDVSSDAPTYPFDPEVAAKALAGTAIVQAITTNQLSRPLEYLDTPISKDRVPFNGWVAVYFPLEPGYKAPRLKLFSAAEITQDAEGFEHALRVLSLRHALAQHTRTVDDQKVIGHEDVFRVQRGYRWQQMREAHRAAPKISSPDPALQAQIEALMARNAEAEALAEEIFRDSNETIQRLQDEAANAQGRLEDTQEHLIELQEQLSAKDYRLETLRAELERLKAQAHSAQRETLAPPTNIIEALQYLEVLHGDEIIILPKAHETAQEMIKQGHLSQEVPRKKAIELLIEALPQVYQAFREADGRALDERELVNRTGFEVSFSESPAVNRDVKLRRYREVRYGEEDKYVTFHAKSGNREGAQIRVYFFFDSEKQKLVVAQVVDHLPTGSSRKDGSRA